MIIRHSPFELHVLQCSKPAADWNSLAERCWYSIQFQDLPTLRRHLDEYRLTRPEHAEALQKLAIGLSFMRPLYEGHVRALIDRIRSSAYQARPDEELLLTADEIEVAAQLSPRHPFTRKVHEAEKGLLSRVDREAERKLNARRIMSCFDPSSHVVRGLVTPTIVAGLQAGETLLSVGAGPAYLEQFLTETFGIKPGQITLTDLEEDLMPSHFPRRVFDMTGEWPGFEEKFDYVFFPESFVAVLKAAKDDWLIDSPNSPRAQLAQGVLRNAIRCLKPGGQVRATSPFLTDGDFYWIAPRLLEEHPALQIRFDDLILIIHNVITL